MHTSDVMNLYRVTIPYPISNSDADRYRQTLIQKFYSGALINGKQLNGLTGSVFYCGFAELSAQ